MLYTKYISWWKKIVRCLIQFSKVFKIYHGHQCTYPCFPGVPLTRTCTPYNILLKPLVASTLNHCQNNGERYEKWILAQWLSSILQKNVGSVWDWTSNFKFSSPVETMDSSERNESWIINPWKEFWSSLQFSGPYEINWALGLGSRGAWKMFLPWYFIWNKFQECKALSRQANKTEQNNYWQFMFYALGILTLYHAIATFNDPEKEAFWKPCWKRRQCW